MIPRPMKLEEERRRAAERGRRLLAELDRMVGILRDLADVELVILFGSFGRGEASVSSDLDLIVVRRDDRRFLERLESLAALLAPSVALDLLVYTPDEFARLKTERPFVAAAVRGGRVLLERPAA